MWMSYFWPIFESGDPLPQCAENLWAHIIFFHLSAPYSLLCDDCATRLGYDDLDRCKELFWEWVETGKVVEQPIFGRVKITEETMQTFDVDDKAADEVFFSALEAIGNIDDDLEEIILEEMDNSDWKQFAYRIDY